MISYTIQRIFVAILIILLATTLLFIMIQFVPGDPVNVMLGPRATPELKEALRERLHLNDPVFVQIYYFFLGLIQGDLGVTMSGGPMPSKFDPVKMIKMEQENLDITRFKGRLDDAERRLLGKKSSRKKLSNTGSANSGGEPGYDIFGVGKGGIKKIKKSQKVKVN